MSDKKEITNEEILELVSGGVLRYRYQANLDEMMACYETINTKKDFLAGFEKRWREGIGKAYLKDKFTTDFSEEVLQECLRYINENYEYKGQVYRIPNLKRTDPSFGKVNFRVGDSQKA